MAKDGERVKRKDVLSNVDVSADFVAYGDGK